MNPSPLLALQVEGVEFALEVGREYSLGTAPHCDLRLADPSAAAIVARVRLGDGVAIVHPAGRSRFELRPGDALRLGGIELRVVVDAGSALILPDPAMRAARADATTAVTAATPPDAAATTGTGTGAATGAGTAAATGVAVAGVVDGIAAAPGAATTFVELMAHELRRAPWFALSLLAHALLLLLLLLLFPPPSPADQRPAAYGFVGDQAAGAAEGADRAPPGPPEIVAEAADVADPALLPAPAANDEDSTVTGLAPLRGDERPDLRLLGGVRIAPRRSGSGGGDVLAGNGTNGAFRQTVTELRRSGLEVVFVLDSTGSMGASIAGAKASIASMLELLRALVPDARFGLVTYRDRGRGEDYVVRTLPLGSDFYAAINFVQSITADGGGDVPEAVLDGLHNAFEQPFRRGARRVVVLAGDAPPHPKDAKPLLEEVRRFASVKDSFVHALFTGENLGDREARSAFDQIAERGKGLSGTVLDRKRILAEVLSLAFGRQFAGDLDAVQQKLEQARRSPPTWALQLARTGGPELAAALRNDVVPGAVVDALLRLPHRDVVNELVGLLAGDSLPPAGRQAVAHVLQGTLGLPSAPIDPADPRPITTPVAATLRELVQRLPE